MKATVKIKRGFKFPIVRKTGSLLQKSKELKQKSKEQKSNLGVRHSAQPGGAYCLFASRFDFAFT
jgi:hypothetical protein